MTRLFYIAMFSLSGCAIAQVPSMPSIDIDHAQTGCGMQVARYRADYESKQKEMADVLESSKDGPLISRAIASGAQASADLARAIHECYGPEGVAPEPPRPIQKDLVRLPVHAPRDLRSVYVRMEFVVLPSGATSNVRLVESSGQRTCDRAAIDAVRRWRYEPEEVAVAVAENVQTCTY